MLRYLSVDVSLRLELMLTGRILLSPVERVGFDTMGCLRPHLLLAAAFLCRHQSREVGLLLGLLLTLRPHLGQCEGLDLGVRVQLHLRLRR